MPQSDGQVQNANFPAFRTDLNDNLAALYSQSSGASAPAVAQPFQPWIDTSSDPAVWKVRHPTNPTTWITIGTIDATTFSTGGITAIANGGTGQTTATAALAALLPSQTGNSGKALTTDGSLASWGIVASGASVQVLTSSGTYTPTANKTTFLVFATGAGGGANGNSSDWSNGGGGGGTAIRLYDPTEMGASASVTIGAVVSGGTGGTTTFDPSGTGLTITGIGGTAGTTTATGAGGGSTNSVISANGQRGGVALGTTGAGPGGSSFWAGGYGRGADGSGGTSSGTAGVVFILEW